MYIVKEKFFLLFSSIVFFLCLVQYICVFNYCIYKGDKHSSWIKNIYQYKDYVASQIDEKKIIFAGGSATLFSINSAIIEENTGYKSVSLGVTANLGLDFLYFKIIEHLKEGDIVVLPLEFDYYEREEESGAFYSDMIAWGYYDYIKKLSLINYIKFIIKTQKRSVLYYFTNKLSYELFGKTYDKEVRLTQDEVVMNLKQILSKHPSKWNGYDYKSLNKYGDINVKDGQPTLNVHNEYNSGIPYYNSYYISKKFYETYKKLSLYVKEKKAKLLLTWPVTIKNKSFDLSNREHLNNVLLFRKKLQSKGIKIYCNPRDSNLDINYFYNTRYHVNEKGSIEHSKVLSRCIMRIIGEKN